MNADAQPCNNKVLAEDEQLSPTFEEMILAYVLGLIDIRLPGHVKKHYCHLIGLTNSIIDFRQCCGSGSRIRLFSIPDPNCLHPGSRIRIKEFKYFNPKKNKKMVSKLQKI